MSPFHPREIDVLIKFSCSVALVLKRSDDNLCLLDHQKQPKPGKLALGEEQEVNLRRGAGGPQLAFGEAKRGLMEGWVWRLHFWPRSCTFVSASGEHLQTKGCSEKSGEHRCP